MSRWIEMPLRPYSTPWPGLGTRVGFLDPGVGFLEDGSVNVMINRGDLLEKRKGFIRGLDEHFPGVVCGLFKYTSTCGIEYLLVADEESIKIRQPFHIPVFEFSDAYPFDNFSEDGPPNSYYWRNIERYIQADDELFMRDGVAETFDPIEAFNFMRWFKDAANLSYQVRIEYEFDPDSLINQQIGIIIKGVDDLTSGSYLMAQIKFGGGTYSFQLYHYDGTTMTEMASFGVTGSEETPTGFLTLSYERDVPAGIYTAKATILPFGGGQQILTGLVNAVQDASLGQTSAIAIGHNGGLPQPSPSILVVDGGPA